MRKAVIDTLRRLTDPFKPGYVPPSALNWGDPDNNNAFHAKEVVMTPERHDIDLRRGDGQQEVVLRRDHELPASARQRGQAGACIARRRAGIHPEGAKNVDAAKDFLRYLIQPANLGGYLKEAKGRWLPVMPSIVHNDPYWLDPKDPHRPPAVRQGVLGPTMTWFYVFNPAYAQVDAEHVFPVAASDVINGMAPEQAMDKAFGGSRRSSRSYQIPHQA